MLKYSRPSSILFLQKIECPLLKFKTEILKLDEMIFEAHQKCFFQNSKLSLRCKSVTKIFASLKNTKKWQLRSWKWLILWNWCVPFVLSAVKKFIHGSFPVSFFSFNYFQLTKNICSNIFSDEWIWTVDFKIIVTASSTEPCQCINYRDILI